MVKSKFFPRWTIYKYNNCAPDRYNTINVVFWNSPAVGTNDENKILTNRYHDQEDRPEKYRQVVSDVGRENAHQGIHEQLNNGFGGQQNANRLVFVLHSPQFDFHQRTACTHKPGTRFGSALIIKGPLVRLTWPGSIGRPSLYYSRHPTRWRSRDAGTDVPQE